MKGGKVRVYFFSFVLSAALIISAGSLSWVMGWIYVAVLLVNTIVLIQLMPADLIAERGRVGEEVNQLDITAALIIGRIGPLAAMLICGLDRRLIGSEPHPLTVQIVGAISTGPGFPSPVHWRWWRPGRYWRTERSKRSCRGTPTTRTGSAIGLIPGVW